MRLSFLVLLACTAHAAPWSWWGNQCPILFDWEGAKVIDWLHLQPECSQFLIQYASTVTSTYTVAGASSTATIVVRSTTTKTAQTVTTIVQTTTSTQTVTAATTTLSSTAPETTIVEPTTVGTTVTSPMIVTITPSPTTVTSYSASYSTSTSTVPYVPAPSPTTSVAPTKRGLDYQNGDSGHAWQFPSQWQACAVELIRDSCEIALGMPAGAQTVTQTETVTGSGGVTTKTVRSLTTAYTTQTSSTTSVRTVQAAVSITKTISGPTTTPSTLSYSTTRSTQTVYSTTSTTAAQSTVTTTLRQSVVYATSVGYASHTQYISLSTSGVYSIFAAAASGGLSAVPPPDLNLGSSKAAGGEPAVLNAELSLQADTYSIITGGSGGNAPDGLGGGGGGGTFVFNSANQLIFALGGGGGGGFSDSYVVAGQDGRTFEAPTGQDYGGSGGGQCGGGAGANMDSPTSGEAQGDPGYAGNDAGLQWAATSLGAIGGYGGGGSGCSQFGLPSGGGGGGYQGGGNGDYERVAGAGGTSWADFGLVSNGASAPMFSNANYANGFVVFIST